jgi:hypothetical protein
MYANNYINSSGLQGVHALSLLIQKYRFFNIGAFSLNFSIASNAELRPSPTSLFGAPENYDIRTTWISC